MRPQVAPQTAGAPADIGTPLAGPSPGDDGLGSVHSYTSQRMARLMDSGAAPEKTSIPNFAAKAMNMWGGLTDQLDATELDDLGKPMAVRAVALSAFLAGRARPHAPAFTRHARLLCHAWLR
jgi:hypothetical protein